MILAVRGKNIPWRRVLSIAGKVVLALAVVIMLLLLFLNKRNLAGGPPQLSGCRLPIITSGSMKPAFGAGNLVAGRDVVPVSLPEGSIITCQDPSRKNRTVTRRIVTDRENMQIVTRRDAANINHPQPIPTELVGVAFAPPLVAYVFDFIQTRTGLLLIIIPSLAIIIYEFLQLWREVIEQLREK